MSKAALPVAFILPGQPHVTVHTATIAWESVEREVFVLTMGRRPLLGTLLLENNDIEMHFTDGGTVKITPIP